MRNFFVLCVLMSLTVFAGCSTVASKEAKKKAKEINYYSLIDIHNVRKDTQSNATTVLLTEIQLSGVINRKNLVTQLQSGQLLLPKKHKWAEDLNKNLAEALLNELHSQTGDFQFEKKSGQWTPKNTISLRLEVNAFHATDLGVVKHSGKFLLYDSNGQLMATKHFAYTQDQIGDGYINTVLALRKTITSLANDILIVLKV